MGLIPDRSETLFGATPGRGTYEGIEPDNKRSSEQRFYDYPAIHYITCAECNAPIAFCLGTEIAETEELICRDCLFMFVQAGELLNRSCYPQREAYEQIDKLYWKAHQKVTEWINNLNYWLINYS